MGLPPNPAAAIKDATVREALRRIYSALAEGTTVGEAYKLEPFRDASGHELLLVRARKGGKWQTVAAVDQAGELYTKGSLHASFDFVAAGWSP